MTTKLQRLRERRYLKWDRIVKICKNGNPIHFYTDLENFFVKEIERMCIDYLSKHDFEAKEDWKVHIVRKDYGTQKNVGKWYVIDYFLKEELLRFIAKHQEMKTRLGEK